MKKIQKLIAVLSLSGMAALTTGLLFLKGTARPSANAKALAETAVERAADARATDGIKTGAAEEENVAPHVIDGAFVRWKNSDGKYGLKFSAYVGEQTHLSSAAKTANGEQTAATAQSGKTYSMKILPRELMTLYEKLGSPSESLGEFCERIAAQYGGELAEFDNLTPKADGTVDCAIIDLQWQNLNRSFFALLCVTDETGKTKEYLSENEGGRYRSIAEVAQNALADNTLQGAERAAVEELLSDAKKQQTGVAIVADNDVAFISGVSDVAVVQKTWSVADGGDGTAHDGWNFAVESGEKVVFNAELIAERIVQTDGMCEFYLYAPKNADISFVGEGGEIVFNVNLQGKRAQKIRVSSAKMRGVKSAVFRFFEGVDVEISGGGVVSCFMSEVVEKSGVASANELKNAIAELPDVATMKAASDEQFAAMKAAVSRAIEWQNALPEAVKLSESSAEMVKLKSLSEVKPGTDEKKRIEATYGKSVFAALDESVELSFTAKNDDTYEKVVQISTTTSEFVATKTKMTIDAQACNAEAKDAKKIVFYAYVEADTANFAESSRLACALSKNNHKNGNNSADLDTFQAEFELKNGQWTEISLSAEEFFVVTCFTLLFDLQMAKKSRVIISPFYACY